MKEKKTSLGKQIDEMYALDAQIDEAESVVRDLKRKRAKLETALLNGFDKDDIDGAKGARGVALIRRVRHAKMKDLRKFWRYVIKNRATDLVQNRISSKAYFDRLQEGESVPGVEIYTSVGVSIRKRKK